MSEDRELRSFGTQVRDCRIQLGMSAEELGRFYAKALGREKSYTGRWIQKMEKTDQFPTDPTRRWVIQQLVQMSTFLSADTLLKERPAPSKAFSYPTRRYPAVDIPSLTQQLEHYWIQGFSRSREEAYKEVQTIIHQLYQAGPALVPQERIKAYRLLCGYSILQAVDIFRAQGDDRNFLKSLDQVITIAKANTFDDLLAVALQQRQAFYIDQGKYQQAVQEYQAVQLLKQVPPQLKGKFQAETSRAKAALAQTQQEQKEALTALDRSERSITASSLSDFPYFVAFDQEKYVLNRAMVLMGSPRKALRSSEEAANCLAIPLHQQKTLFSLHRQTHSHIIQAGISLDRGWYPIAITLLDEAIQRLESIHSRIHLYEIAQVYEGLKKSPLGESTDVTMLEIGIVRLRSPHLFTFH